jgi:integrase
MVKRLSARSRLKPGGAASHLAAITRDDLARRYGYFLDFLKRMGHLNPRASAGAQVTPENVSAYITELQSRVSSVTVYGSIYKLRRAAELIARCAEFSWLAEIEKDLALLMQPKSKFDRVVLSGVLVEAGLGLVAKAEQSGRTELKRARDARDGLMIALLALCPIRLKNFAALTLGQSFAQMNGSWWIILAKEATKSRRVDERRVPDILNPAINVYLNQHRLVLARFQEPPTALWLARNNGAPMTYAGVARAITDATQSTIGVPISPHLFRAAAASTAAFHAGEMPYLASSLLSRTDPRVTEEHYNRANTMSAARVYAAIVHTLTCSTSSTAHRRPNDAERRR